jgi:hypothetical protein
MRRLWACGLVLLAAGCGTTFTDMTRTNGTRLQRFYANAAPPEGAAFLVPREEIGRAQARQRKSFYEAIYDNRGHLQVLRRHVQGPYGPLVQMEIRYFCDSGGRLVRELIRARDDQGRIHAGERLYDGKGNLVAEREVDARGRPVEPVPPADRP